MAEPDFEALHAVQRQTAGAGEHGDAGEAELERRQLAAGADVRTVVNFTESARDLHDPVGPGDYCQGSDLADK